MPRSYWRPWNKKHTLRIPETLTKTNLNLLLSGIVFGMSSILINLAMLRCIQYQTKLQFPKQATIPVENHAVLAEQKQPLFHIFIHEGAQDFCRLKSLPNLYFEPLTITPEIVIEIKHHLLKIRSVKAIQGIHWALWETIQWPIFLFIFWV